MTRPDESDVRRVAQQIRAGDADVLAAIFREQYGPLCTFALAVVRAPDVAEEIVQDVFLALWTKREEIDIRTSVRAYLYRATHNRALNAVQRARRERRWVEESRAEVDADSLAGSAPQRPDGAVESSEMTRAVERAIAELPERAQLAIRLRWRHQLSQGEIASVMGISVKGVEALLARARDALRASLDEFTPM